MSYSTNSTNATNPSASSSSSALVQLNESREATYLPFDLFDLFTRILTYLDVSTITACNTVCQNWKQWFTVDSLWHNLVDAHFPFYTHVPQAGAKQTTYREAYQTLHLNRIKGVCASYNLEVREGLYRSSPNYFAIFGNNQLIADSGDDAIAIWDIKTGACKILEEGLKQPVSCLTVLGDRLVLGFEGGKDFDGDTIQIRNIETGARTTLAGHKGSVNCFEVLGGQLVSGDIDGTIKIWDVTTGTCTATLEGHKNSVECFAVLGDQLVSGYEGGTIKIWDVTTGTCTTLEEGHKNSVACFAVLGDRLIAGYEDGTIKIWDATTDAWTTLEEGRENEEGLENSVNCFAVLGGQLVSGYVDGTIKIWDVKKGICTATLEGHKNPVNCLAVLRDLLISGSSHTLKVWDFAADHDIIFKEIAELLKNQDPIMQERAMRRFFKMPKAAIEQILGPLQRTDISSFGKRTHDHDKASQPNGLKNQYTPAQVAWAIQKYLLEKSLQHLGLVSSVDYLKELGCKPANLQQIGLFSPADISFICSPLTTLQKLPIVEEGNALQVAADLRKQVKLIEEAVNQKIEETNERIALIIYPFGECPWISNNPWIPFKESIRKYNLQQLEEVSAEKCKMLIHGLNALVDDFHVLDCNHQIAKLRAYIHQVGIKGVWQRLKQFNVASVSELLSLGAQPLDRPLDRLLSLDKSLVPCSWDGFNFFLSWRDSNY